jgi:uroporphyrinogen decarboxylase
MQSSLEVVRNAVHFRTPDRLPVFLDSLGLSDRHWVGWNQTGTGDHSQRQSLDEWGCMWSRTEEKNMGQITGHPLFDWSALSEYRWPDPDDPAFYTGMEERFRGSEGRYVVTSIFMLLFERMHGLRGFPELLMDLLLEPERAATLADRIVEFDLGVIRRISHRFPGRIHGFSFTDDWGTERGTFVSTELFDSFFVPRYRKLFEACRANGWDVWMHSCGRVNDFVPSLIGAGVDVLNLQQPTTNGIRELGRRFAGKVCFESLCDIQRTLPFGSEAEIEAEAKELMEWWGTPEGGFILSDYGDGAAIGVPIERKKAMLEAFLRNDRWKRAP